MDNEMVKTEEEDLDMLLQRINEERDGDEDSTTQLFKIKSDIGRDDYRAFVYYSVLKKSNWVLPAYILLPPIISTSFAVADGKLNLPLALGVTGALYLLLFLVIVVRTERSISKTNQKNPDLMKLTPTTFTFLNTVIVNAKKGTAVRVPYKSLQKVRETKKRMILYFTGKKAMIIRKEDIERDAGLEKFKTFIISKINK